MPCKKDVDVVRTIGIDTGKNTLHVAEQALELRLLKKSMIADGDGEE